MLMVHLFVTYAHVNLCHFFSSCWCRRLLRLLLVALSGLFCLTFYSYAWTLFGKNKETVNIISTICMPN